MRVHTLIELDFGGTPTPFKHVTLLHINKSTINYSKFLNRTKLTFIILPAIYEYPLSVTCTG